MANRPGNTRSGKYRKHSMVILSALKDMKTTVGIVPNRINFVVMQRPRGMWEEEKEQILHSLDVKGERIDSILKKSIITNNE